MRGREKKVAGRVRTEEQPELDLAVVRGRRHRKQASERNRSLSAWIGGLVREATATEWPRSLVDLLRHGNANLVEPDDPPPEDVETLR